MINNNKEFLEALSIKNLNISYEQKSILEDINLKIPVGVRCAIVGPNGAGKTSLIKTILGLHKEFNGEFKFFEKNFSEVMRKIAYVPQRKNVDWNFPITVKDVVMMGASDLTYDFFNKNYEQNYLKVKKALLDVEMESYENYHINSLSGGQQQRIFVARALAQEADLYIMDEPFTGLDKNSENAISEIFFKLQAKNKTIIAVHHDWNTLQKYFDWIIFLNKKILYSGEIKNCDLSFYFNQTFSF